MCKFDNRDWRLGALVLPHFSILLHVVPSLTSQAALNPLDMVFRGTTMPHALLQPLPTKLRSPMNVPRGQCNVVAIHTQQAICPEGRGHVP